MIRMLLGVAAVIVFFPAGAFAQAGSIGVFADPIGADCALPNGPPGLVKYQVVHINTAAAAAVEFRAPKPICLDAVWLSDTAYFALYVGNTQQGMSIGYGVCTQGPIHVAEMNFFMQTGAPPCTCYPVKGKDGGPNPMVLDCANNSLPAGVECGVINTNATCGCLHVSCGCIHCGTVAAEVTTLSRIKALYR